MSEGDLLLTEPIPAREVLQLLYACFPGLLARVPGRAYPEIIERHLRLVRNGAPIRSEDCLCDEDLLAIFQREEPEWPGRTASGPM